MNFECFLNELSDAYSKIAKFASATTDPVFKMVRLTVSEDPLTNEFSLVMDLSTNIARAQISIPVQTGTVGSVCVDSTIFQKSVRKSAAEFKQYNFTEDGMGTACAVVTDGNKTVTERSNAFSISAATIFTTFVTGSSGSPLPKVTVSVGELKTALDLAKAIMDPSLQNETYKYMAWEIDPSDSSLRLVSTNGTQMARVDIEATIENTHNSIEFNLNLVDISVLFSALVGSEDKDKVCITVYDNHIVTSYPSISAGFAISRTKIAGFNWRSVMNYFANGTLSFDITAAALRDMTQGIIYDSKPSVQLIKLYIDEGILVSQSGNSVAGETIKTNTDASANGFAVTLDAAKVQKAISAHKKNAVLTFTDCGTGRLLLTPKLGQEISGLKHFSQIWSTIL